MLVDMTDPNLRDLELLIQRMEKGETFHRQMAEARRLLAEVRRDLEAAGGARRRRSRFPRIG
jgi:predicted component of type VI protein secretion system